MSVTSSQFRVVMVQAVAFVASPPAAPQSAQLALLTALRDDLDSDSVQLRTLSQLPSGVPFLSAKSCDGRVAFDVSMLRIAASWHDDGAEDSRSADDAMEECATGVVRCATEMGVTVGRVAGVVHRVTECERPGVELSRMFCKEEWTNGPLNRPEGFELHAHKEFEFGDGFRVNSWMRIRTGGVTHADGTQRSIVHVEQDQNTLAERLNVDTYDGPRMKTFFARVLSEMDGVVDQYFPESM